MPEHSSLGDCRLVLFALGAILAGSGCGRSDLPPMAPAEGVILLDGMPLTEASVSFTPVDGGRSSRGKTDSQGRFAMGTFERGDGAYLGEHRVAVNPIKAPPPSYMINPKAARGYTPPFPDRYWSSKSSGLTATVKAGETNEFKFELESR